jgi:hypothetical protein
MAYNKEFEDLEYFSGISSTFSDGTSGTDQKEFQPHKPRDAGHQKHEGHDSSSR